MPTARFLYLFLLLPCVAGAQSPVLEAADRIRLAEAFRLAGNVQDAVWPGWSDVPFAVLLVTPEHEFLVRHPYPSDDFLRVTAYDSLLESAVHVRDRQFPLNLLATFPAVSNLPTVVVGQPAQTGKTSTYWAITLLHEHFHQLQYAQSDYAEAVASLDLAGEDRTGMWMLNYPFPYDSAAIVEPFSNYRDELLRTLQASHEMRVSIDLDAYRSARARIQDALSAADYRYLSFQLWQEGVARYTEYQVARAAARQHEPLAAFQDLPDFVPYDAAADSLLRALADELAALDLAAWKRTAFYPLGAAEALLLDAVQPDWRGAYLSRKFYLERYLDE